MKVATTLGAVGITGIAASVAGGAAEVPVLAAIPPSWIDSLREGGSFCLLALLLWLLVRYMVPAFLAALKEQRDAFAGLIGGLRDDLKANTAAVVKLEMTIAARCDDK
jgi:hypothetical protein